SSYKPATNQTHADTVMAIGKMFPSIVWNNIDWTGNNNPQAFPANGILLEGDQCLVFFLGGIPSASGNPIGCTGFSKSTTNPAAPGGERLKFYDFQSARLSTTLRPNNPFYSYLNAYTSLPQPQPYVYLSARYGYTAPTTGPGYNSPVTGRKATDCSKLAVN